MTLKENHELMQRGPYRLVRHPIYTGLIAMIVAIVLLRGRIASIVALLFVVTGFWLKANTEEALMLEQFRDDYASYQQRVKRLIPFLL